MGFVASRAFQQVMAIWNCRSGDAGLIISQTLHFFNIKSWNCLIFLSWWRVNYNAYLTIFWSTIVSYLSKFKIVLIKLKAIVNFWRIYTMLFDTNLITFNHFLTGRSIAFFNGIINITCSHWKKLTQYGCCYQRITIVTLCFKKKPI